MAGRKLSIRRAAPGTFFSLFGCIIICYVAIGGFQVITKNGLQVRTNNPDSIAAAEISEDEILIESGAPLQI